MKKRYYVEAKQVVYFRGTIEAESEEEVHRLIDEGDDLLEEYDSSSTKVTKIRLGSS